MITHSEMLRSAGEVRDRLAALGLPIPGPRSVRGLQAATTTALRTHRAELDEDQGAPVNACADHLLTATRALRSNRRGSDQRAYDALTQALAALQPQPDAAEHQEQQR